MGKINYLVQDDVTFLGVIDSMPAAMIITNPDFSINYVNPAFVQLTGFELEDVKGCQAPYPWWPIARRREYLDELSVVMRGQKHKSDWLFEAKDGHQFWIKANVAPVRKNGKVRYLLACWTDITSNKMAEERLLKKLEELTKTAYKNA